MGKTHSKPLVEGHGRGTAWAWHGHGILCVSRPYVFTYPPFTTDPHPVMFKTFVLHILPPYFSRNVEILDRNAAGVYYKMLWKNCIKIEFLSAGRACGARFFAPDQTGPGTQTASCTVDAESLSQGVIQSGRDVDHPPHLTRRLKKG